MNRAPMEAGVSMAGRDEPPFKTYLTTLKLFNYICMQSKKPASKNIVTLSSLIISSRLKNADQIGIYSFQEIHHQQPLT